MYEWEEYIIKITHADESQINAEQAGEITDRFESELFKLIQKYQDQGGLSFIATTSADQPIQQYY